MSERLRRRRGGGGRRNGMLDVAAMAIRLARRCVRRYAHRNSPQRFTQPQLLACLILKALLRFTYRGVEDILAISPALRETLGLTCVPHFTTLQKFASAVNMPALLDALLACCVRQVIGPRMPRVRDVVIDATGMESGCASAYFLTRAGRKRSRWIKTSVVALCDAVMPMALHVDWGPSGDPKHALPALRKAATLARPRRVWGDAGYDSESVHAFCFEVWRSRSYAPPIRRHGSTVLRSRYRRRMRDKPRDYGRRWTIESLFSAIKRICGSALTARREHTLKAEAALRIVAYAVRRQCPRATMNFSTGQITNAQCRRKAPACRVRVLLAARHSRNAFATQSPHPFVTASLRHFVTTIVRAPSFPPNF